MSHTPRVALVSGARTGLGLATALALSAQGFIVYAGLHNVSEFEPLLTRAMQSSLSIHPVALDVTKPSSIQVVLNHIHASHGALDVLVNNAGIALDGPVEQLNIAALRHAFEVNTLGALSLAQAAIPAMRVAKKGKIINVSSVSGRIAMPMMGGYAATKYALEALTESLRYELAGSGVQACLVEPGPYRSELFRRPIEFEHLHAALVPLAQRFAKARERLTPHMGDPSHFGLFVAHLANQPYLKARYPVGPFAKMRLRLREVLPEALFEGLVAKSLKLPRP